VTSRVQKVVLERADAPALTAAETKAANAEAERELVRRAQKGDDAAYEQLVRMHHHRILAVIGGILRHREDVEDVAQQALVKAYFSLKRFDQRSAFGTWLYKIAVNECWDYFRKKKVRRLVYEGNLSEEQLRQMERAEEGDDGGAVRRTPDAERNTEQRQLIDRLLSGLDDQDRTMLIMKEVEGFTVGEIGAVLGLNVNTVKVRLFRARGRLAKAYRRIRDAKPVRPR
jgi:RNA polymerase sigma-70 factor (ECF subfamily)